MKISIILIFISNFFGHFEFLILKSYQKWINILRKQVLFNKLTTEPHYTWPWSKIAHIWYIFTWISNFGGHFEFSLKLIHQKLTATHLLHKIKPIVLQFIAYRRSDIIKYDRSIGFKTPFGILAAILFHMDQYRGLTPRNYQKVPKNSSE